jgi:Fibronectin type III domain
MITPVASVITSSTTIAGIFRRTRALDRLRTVLRISAVLASGFILAGPARANQSASLAWNPVSNMPVAGYAIYVGNSSGNYTSRFDVGTNTQITLTGLQEGTTNYFAVTAYNSARLESPVSSAVPYIIPGLVRFAMPTAPGGAGTVSFPVAVGHSYELQASTNLTTWSNLWQTSVYSSNIWVSYQDPKGTSSRERFYRLIMQ